MPQEYGPQVRYLKGARKGRVLKSADGEQICKLSRTVRRGDVSKLGDFEDWRISWSDSSGHANGVFTNAMWNAGLWAP